LKKAVETCSMKSGPVLGFLQADGSR